MSHDKPLTLAIQRGAINISSPSPIEVSNTWISTIMHNNKYTELVSTNTPSINSKDIVAAISAAICAAGYNTSPAALRALAAEDVSLADFESRKDAYLTAIHRSRDLATKITHLKKVILPALISRTKNSPQIQPELTAAKLRRDELVAECRAIHAFVIARYPNMETVDTLAKFKVYIQSSIYIADDFIIRILERALKIQIIVFSTRAYKSHDLSAIVATAGHRELNSAKSFVLVSRIAANNVSSIAYNGNTLIPYADLSSALIQKCKSTYILRITYLKPTIMAVAGLYNPECAIAIGNNTDATAYPCTGPSEFCLRETLLVDFAQLATSKQNWRKWIADDWCHSPIRVNGKTYASVEHCCAAFALATEFPDIAQCFAAESMHSWSRISASKAIEDIKKSGPAERVRMTSPAVQRIARTAKFEQYPDLAKILCATYPALILGQLHIINSVREPDICLMRLRETLRISHT